MSRRVKKWAPSFVSVVTTMGLSTMGLAGCESGKDDRRTVNPPPPPPPETATAAPTPVIARNPPAPEPPSDSPDLPDWDDVPSGHPAGATNPPSPVLQLHPDGRCFKSWEGGLGGLPQDVSSKTFGEKTFMVRVLAADAAEVRGKQITCPDGAAEALKKDADEPAAK